MKLKKFQQGGSMDPAMEPAPAPQAAPMEGRQAEAEEQIAQIAGQLLEMLLQELGDPNAVAMVLQAALEMLSQASQGAPQEAPVFKKGGKLVKAKKACGGIKVK